MSSRPYQSPNQNTPKKKKRKTLTTTSYSSPLALSSPSNGRMFEGLYVPTVTAFDHTGAPDLQAIPTYAEALLADGCSGIWLTGTSGESMGLSVAERRAILEAWINAVGPQNNRKLKIIAHVGAQSLPDSCDLAAHAERVGADGIACMATCFFKPAGVEDLVDYCAKVASSAPQTPFMYYHFPTITGVNHPMYAFVKSAEKKIPTMQGAKFTHSDFNDLGKCLQHYPNMDFMPGYENMFLSGLCNGATGFVGISFSLIAPLYTKIINQYNRGDTKGALDSQHRVNDFWEKLESCGGHFISAHKVLVGNKLGTPFGSPRLPLRGLTLVQQRKLATAMEEWGLSPDGKFSV